MEDTKTRKKVCLTVSIILFIGIILLLFVNIFTLRIKVDGVNYYFNFSLSKLLAPLKFSFYNEDNLIYESQSRVDVFSYLFIIFLSLGLIFFALTYTLKESKTQKVFNYLSISSYVISIISIVLVPLLLPYFYNLNNYSSYKDLTVEKLFYIAIIVLILVNLTISLSFIKKDKRLFSIYDISEMAILVALALVLDKIKIPVGETGGSINLSALPLMIYSYRRGWWKGLIASSIVFGLISNIFDGYGIITYPFDYLIAFSGYSLIGLYVSLFKKLMSKDSKNYLIYFNISIVLGGLSAFITRMIGSSISSIVLYGLDLKAALIYNLAYIPVSVASSTIALCLLSYPLMYINNKFPTK